MKSQPRKFKLYREAQELGAPFVANVIFCHHSKPTRKLEGLVTLLRRGVTVTPASFSMDILQFDGAGAHSYSELEQVGREARS
jgi:hypothetical protein